MRPDIMTTFEAIAMKIAAFKKVPYIQAHTELMIKLAQVSEKIILPRTVIPVDMRPS